jgi:hypothetical protein
VQVLQAGPTWCQTRGRALHAVQAAPVRLASWQDVAPTPLSVGLKAMRLAKSPVIDTCDLGPCASKAHYYETEGL